MAARSNAAGVLLFTLLATSRPGAAAEAGQPTCTSDAAGPRECGHPERALLQMRQGRERIVLDEALAEECAEPWAQCGGKMAGGVPWSGPTCCVPGYVCEVANAWWSSCMPSHKSDPDCAGPFEQCGGKKRGGAAWDGPTCCEPGYSCQYKSDWWSSCKPGSGPSPTPPAGPAPSATAAPTGAPSLATTALPTEPAAQATTPVPTKAPVPAPTPEPPTPAPPTPAPPTPAPPTPTPERTTPPPTAPARPIATTPGAAPSPTTTPTTDAAKPRPGVSRGIVTMWSTQESLIGAQCEYANAPVNSLTDPVLPSYLRSGFHCAIGDSNPGFGRGENCGKCYKLTSLSDTGTAGTPGSKGSAVVMVSDGGAGGDGHFDCILEGFKEITGAETGIFDIEFEEVVCDDVTGGPVVINWADQNAWYCKMMFGNIGGWGQLESVRACLDGSECTELEQFSGATWTGCPSGTGSSMRFELTQRAPSGAESTVTCDCPGAWPWPTGRRCECPENFVAATTA